MVTAGPPGMRLVLAIGRPVGFTVNVWVPMVKIDGVGDDAAPSVIVEDPMRRCDDESSDSTVPETVIAGPPGKIDVVAIAKPVGTGVMVWEPTVKIN